MDGVIFMMIGERHAEHLVVAVWQLRKVWKGSIGILVGDDGAMPLCESIADATNDVQLVKFSYDSIKGKHGRGSTYLAKTQMHRFSPFDRTVFLDADTVAVNDFSELFPEANEVCITQWLDWVTTGKIMRGRLLKWEKHAKAEVDRQLAKAYPSINTGVLGFSTRCHAFMDAWHEMTLRNVCFMCDELACQLIYLDYPHKVFDARWNATPVYADSWQRYGLNVYDAEALDELTFNRNGEMHRVVPEHELCKMLAISIEQESPSDVRVWHGHGMKFIKRSFGRAIWWPAYRECLDANFCKIADWSPKMRKLKAYYNDPTVYEAHDIETE